MKKKSWILSLITTMALSVALTACGGGNSEKPASSAEPAAEGKEYTVKIAYENQPGEPIDLAVQEWKRLAEEKTNGKLKVELYPSSQLGSKSDVIEQMKMGANVITIADGAFFMDYVPDFGILYAPYLTDSYEQMFKLIDSEFFKGLETELQGKGLHIVTAKWVYGDRHLITNKPVTTPEDLKGLKVRVPNIPLMIQAMETMGATPTPMPLGEVYPALAQGVINGMENPLPVIVGSKSYESAKHIALTGHIQNVSQWVAGQSFIETLPEDILKALKEAGDEAGVFGAQKVAEADAKALEEMKAAGVTVTEVDKALFKEAVKPMYNNVKEWSPGLYDKVQEIIKQ